MLLDRAIDIIDMFQQHPSLTLHAVTFFHYFLDVSDSDVLDLLKPQNADKILIKIADLGNACWVVSYYQPPRGGPINPDNTYFIMLFV